MRAHELTWERIIIRGPTRALELSAVGGLPADDMLRTSKNEWCARSDSNARPSDS